MSETGKYDVIIAGAGPAGSTAGFLLSKSGLKVLLIDKDRFPRKKLCAGLITHKTVRLLQRVFGLTVKSLSEKGIINYEAGSYEIRSRNSIIAQGTYGIPFHFIDREQYDDFILSMARKVGANIIEGDRITSLDVLKSAVTTASGKQFLSRVIIGADGVNSRIRRSFPTDLFGREDWNKNLAAAHEIVVSRNDMEQQVNHPVHYYDFIEFGYAWLFPNREKVIIGMCGLKSKNSKNILSAFREFLSAIHVKLKQDQKIFSSVLPYGNFLPEPVFRNILLVGDAAGLADPLLGEGIFYAQRSGELAAHAILNSIDKDAFHDMLGQHYLRSLRTHIFTELVYAGKIQETIFRRLRNFRWLPLRILMTMSGDRPVEAVHGIRSYRWLKKSIDI